MTRIKNVIDWNGIQSNSTYLLLISPEKIPHLALVSKGGYFSLTHKKSIISEPFEPYLAFLERSLKRMLFVELTINPEELEDIFKQYQQVNTENITCLFPIRQAILPESKAEFVYDLIPELEENGLVKAIYHINMRDLLSENRDFELSAYSKTAIFAYIESLNHKYAKRS